MSVAKQDSSEILSNDVANDNVVSQLVLTTAAAQKVYSLMVEEDNLNLKLRVYITGGGCSGFQYGFTFEEVAEDDDTQVQKKIAWPPCEEDMASEDSSKSDIADDSVGVLENNKEIVTVTLLVDPLSYPYLASAEIDYREDVNGAQFVIRNPNAKTTCGCGSSFSA